MKAIKSKSLRLFGGLVFLLVGIVLSLTFLSNGSISAFAAENDQVVFAEKVYSRATIDENFDGSSIIVILDKNISGINKSHNKEFFKDIEILEIEDLSVVADSAKSIINTKNFEQTLHITLPQDSKENVLQTIKKLEGMDGIKYVGPNRYREIERDPNDPLYIDALGGERSQWGLQRIQADLAWNITTGNNTVRVGIIDTGIGVIVDGQANHPDLNANLVNAGGDFVNMTSIPNNTPGALRADTSGHGTHVAGIVGAVGNNGVGVSGVNWNVSLVPMQVATGAAITDAACVRAVRFATNTWNTANRISILSMSIGGGGVWPDMETAIRDYPGLFVCSTGNTIQNNDVTRHYPSFYGSALHTNPLQNMISVGRSDINDERPTGAGVNANWGAQTITLFAPGHNIVSTYPTAGVTSNWGVGYHRTSGSSMATPMVTGVAALLLSVNANLTTAQLRAAIVNNVDVLPAFENDPTNGRQCVTGGRLNAFKALSSVVFTTSNVSGGISINGFINGYTMPNNTNLILPDRFAPQGSTVQQSVVAIGSSAFANQMQMSQISIPASVTSIGVDAFYNCSSLSNITVASGNSIYKSDGNCIIKKSNNELVAGCKASVIPSYVTSIGERAFSGCSGLTSITIPNGVTSIGDYAFYFCTDLENISIPNSVSSIKPFTFYNCYSLETINLPYNVTSIGEHAFSGCSGLTSITIPNGVASIGNYAFYFCTGLDSISIPNSVSYIGNNAFDNCRSLISVTIPSGVSSIKEYTFYSCYSLTNIIIPNSITSIGPYAFSYCYGVSATTIPSSMLSIREYAFFNCTSLERIEIPSSVDYMSEDVFRNCNKLTIYAEAESRPSSWNLNWNVSNRRVVWGYLDDIEDGGIYYIKNQKSGLYMDVSNYSGDNGALLIQYQLHKNTNQQFKLNRISADIYEFIPMTNVSRRVDIDGESTANNASVQIWDSYNNAAQSFKIERINSQGAYKILTKSTNYAKCLTVQGGSTGVGASIVQYDYGHYGASDHWNFEMVSEKGLEEEQIYFIRNQKSGLYMDVVNYSGEAGALLNQYNLHKNTNQQFKLKKLSADEYEIIPMTNISLRVDINSGSNANGTSVLIWNSLNNTAQRFKIIKVNDGSGAFKILTNVSNYTKCLAVQGASTVNSAYIIQWDYGYNGTFDNDHWYFEKYYP